MFCDTFMPLSGEVYYSVESQNELGGVEKVWTIDHSIQMSLSMSTNYKDQQVQPDQMMWFQDSLNGRSIKDPRVDSGSSYHATTNVLITNIRDSKGNEVYIEPAGQRVGLSTIYELAGCMPHNGPFGVSDYFKIVLKRSDDQELD